MILNTGDIPNLYDNEERLEIIEKVRIICSFVYYKYLLNLLGKYQIRSEFNGSMILIAVHYL